jgi:hypothetical protein
MVFHVVPMKNLHSVEIGPKVAKNRCAVAENGQKRPKLKIL